MDLGESLIFYVQLKTENGRKTNAILFHGQVLRELGPTAIVTSIQKCSTKKMSKALLCLVPRHRDRGGGKGGGGGGGVGGLGAGRAIALPLFCLG